MPRRNRCCLSPYCTSDASIDENQRYFSIPKVKVGPICEVTKILSQKRRSLWLKVLGLTEADTEGRERILVCSKHFVSGRPEYEMYERGVDWVPSLNIPISKIIPIPPPTEEHSYCQTSVPPTAYNWKTTVSDKNKTIVQRCSHRLPILKKKKEKANEKAFKAQQKAEAIAKKIQEKKKKKKRLAIKKAKREEKRKRAEKEAANLIKNANKKSKTLLKPMLNQVESIDIRMPSNLLISNEDIHKLLKKTSEASQELDALGSDSITNGITEMLNKLPSVSDISSARATGQPISYKTGPSSQHQAEANLDVACRSKVTSSSTPALKNEFLQQLALNQIGQGSGRKSTPIRITSETRSSDAPKRAAEPIKLPSKILILRKDGSAKTSRTVITLKPSINTSCHPVQNYTEKIMKQIQTHLSSSATAQQQSGIAKNSSTAEGSSTTAILKTLAAEPLEKLQPPSKILIPRKNISAKIPQTVEIPKPSVNPPCRVATKNMEVLNHLEITESEPVPQNELNVRNVETYIRDLMLKKNTTSHGTIVNTLLQKLMEHHQVNILNTRKLVPTAQITQDKGDDEIVDLTKDECDYILPDAAPNKLCPTCNCRNSVEEITLLRSQLEKKSTALESYRRDLDNLKKELCEAKEYISNLSAQLQENTQALCSYLAKNPHEIQK